jgi:hypothetical protein
MSHKKAVTFFASGLRWMAGLLYTLVGLNGLLHIRPMPEGTTPAGTAFFSALHASGFMLVLLGASFLAGGLLLLLNRTAPLGLVVLAPPIVVIPFYNALLERHPFTSGPFVVGIHLFLAWYYWDRFKSLWNTERQMSTST